MEPQQAGVEQFDDESYLMGGGVMPAGTADPAQETAAMELMDAEAGGIDTKHNERQELLERFKSHHAEALAFGRRSLRERRDAARVLWAARQGIEGSAWASALEQAEIILSERTCRKYLAVGEYLEGAGYKNGDPAVTAGSPYSPPDSGIAVSDVDHDGEPYTFEALVEAALNWRDARRAAEEERKADEWRKRDEQAKQDTLEASKGRGADAAERRAEKAGHKATGHEEKAQELRGRVERRSTGGMQVGLPFGPGGEAQPEEDATGTPAAEPKQGTGKHKPFPLSVGQAERPLRVLGRVDMDPASNVPRNGDVKARHWTAPGDDPEYERLTTEEGAGGWNVWIGVGEGKRAWEAGVLEAAVEAYDAGFVKKLMVEFRGSPRGRDAIHAVLVRARAVAFPHGGEDVDCIAYLDRAGDGAEAFHKALGDTCSVVPIPIPVQAPHDA